MRKNLLLVIKFCTEQKLVTNEYALTLFAPVSVQKSVIARRSVHKSAIKCKIAFMPLFKGTHSRNMIIGERAIHSQVC